MNTKSLCALAALCLAAGPAPAQDVPADAQREKREQAAARLHAADRNGDGLISREEAAAGLPRIAKRFDQLDGNRDGQLSPEEIRDGIQQLRGQR